jgi:hypothetical protein
MLGRHRITSSARTRIDCGIEASSALAVLVWTTSSTFVAPLLKRPPRLWLPLFKLQHSHVTRLVLHRPLDATPLDLADASLDPDPEGPLVDDLARVGLGLDAGGSGTRHRETPFCGTRPLESAHLVLVHGKDSTRARATRPKAS